MKSETRIIKASVLTGISDLCIGLLLRITKLDTWYYEHFKLFGVLGVGMILYGFWHWVLYSINKR